MVLGVTAGDLKLLTIAELVLSGSRRWQVWRADKRTATCQLVALTDSSCVEHPESFIAA